MRIIALCICAAALAACNPMDLANAATKRAAKVVVVNVMSQNMPAPVAEAAADCIVDAASPAELRALAADIAVNPGTQTVANVANLATRPSAVECLSKSAIPMVMAGGL